MPGLREREQGMRCPALDQNVRLDVGETAGCIEHLANRVTRVQQQQRKTHEAANIDHAGAAKLQRWSTCGQNLICWQCAALEAAIASLVVSDTEVNLAAFQ